MAAAVSHAGAGEVPEDFKLMSLSDVSVNSSEAASLEDLFLQQNLNFLLLCWTFHVLEGKIDDRTMRRLLKTEHKHGGWRVSVSFVTSQRGASLVSFYIVDLDPNPTAV